MVVYLVKATEQNKDTAMKDLVQSVRVTNKFITFLFQKLHYIFDKQYY